MNKILRITYWWKCSELGTIPEEFKETLEEDALNRITEQWKQGYKNGELYSEIEDHEFSGWFSIVEEGEADLANRVNKK